MSVFVSNWCFRVCWLVFCGAFQHGLWCASMLLGVTAVRMGVVDAGGSAGREISEEEGALSLIPSSTVSGGLLFS